MMKKLILFSFFLLLSLSSFGQTTTVTGTVIDAQGQAWANGNWRAELIIPSAKTGTNPLLNGVPIDCAVGHQCNSYSGSLDGTGALSQVLASNNQITPSGTSWRFTICPNASSNCVSTNVTISGGSQSITAVLSAVAGTPQVSPQPSIARAYRDQEVLTAPGQVWLDVALGVLKYVDQTGTVRQVGGGGGSGNAITIQGNNVQVGTATISGQYYVWNTTAGAFVLQTKPIIDVRDVGIDCTFATDSAPALNALTNNAQAGVQGHAIEFPPNCHVKIASTWLIKNMAGLDIRGAGIAGNTASNAVGVPTLTYTGAPGGIMVDMQYTDGFDIHGLVFDLGGLAGTGLRIDSNIGGGTIISSDGRIYRNMFSGNQTGAPQAGVILIAAGQISLNNTEDMRFENNTFFCGSNDTTGIGIQLGNNFNTKNYTFIHNYLHNCNKGVQQNGGSAQIAANELGGNGTDIELNFWTDPQEAIWDNLGESAATGEKFLNVTSVSNHIVDIAGNNIPLNNTCAITFTGGTYSASRGNTFYNGFGAGAGGFKICNTGAQGALVLAGGQWEHNLSNTDIVHFISQGGKGEIQTTHYNSADTMSILSGGASFVDRFWSWSGADNYELGFVSAASASIPSVPCGFNSPECLYEGATEITGVTSPDGLICTVTGVDTSTLHVYTISAIDSGGNETLLRRNSFNSSLSQCNGPATYDGSHFETLTWLASPNASTYKIYASQGISPNATWALLASGLTCCTFIMNGPYPSSFTTSLKSLYNATLIKTERWKEIDHQFGTKLKGFSDKGITQTWSIDSATGVGAWGSQFSYKNTNSLNFSLNSIAANRAITVPDPLASAFLPFVTGTVVSGDCAKFSGTSGILIDNGTGCGGLTGLTPNVLLKALTSSTATNSSITDNGTTVSTTEPISVAQQTAGLNYIGSYNDSICQWNQGGTQFFQFQMISSVVTLNVNNGGCVPIATTSSTFPLSQLLGGIAPSGQTYDFSAVTLFKSRIGAALSTSIAGDSGFDTTNSMWHFYSGAADAIIPVMLTTTASAVTNGQCAIYSVSGNTVQLGAQTCVSGGTVSANSGSAGAIGRYAAAGGSTTIGPDTLLTDNGTTLVYTGTGGLVLPNGSGAGTYTLTFAAASTFGFYSKTAAQIVLGNSGTDIMSFLTIPAFQLGSGGSFRWASTAASSGSADLTMCRSAANILEIGTTVCNANGTIILAKVGTNQLQANSAAAPTCAFTSGGGTTPSCALDTGSSDAGGSFTATTGTGSPASNGAITLTFAATLGTNGGKCTFTLSDASAGQWNARATAIGGAFSTASSVVNWDNNAVTLSTSTAYKVTYHCYGN